MLLDGSGRAWGAPIGAAARTRAFEVLVARSRCLGSGNRSRPGPPRSAADSLVASGLISALQTLSSLMEVLRRLDKVKMLFAINRPMAHDVISTCPVCSNELAITRLHCGELWYHARRRLQRGAVRPTELRPARLARKLPSFARQPARDGTRARDQLPHGPGPRRSAGSRPVASWARAPTPARMPDPTTTPSPSRQCPSEGRDSHPGAPGATRDQRRGCGRCDPRPREGICDDCRGAPRPISSIASVERVSSP